MTPLWLSLHCVLRDERELMQNLVKLLKATLKRKTISITTQYNSDTLAENYDVSADTRHSVKNKDILKRADRLVKRHVIFKYHRELTYTNQHIRTLHIYIS